MYNDIIIVLKIILILQGIFMSPSRYHCSPTWIFIILMGLGGKYRFPTSPVCFVVKKSHLEPRYTYLFPPTSLLYNPKYLVIGVSVTFFDFSTRSLDARSIDCHWSFIWTYPMIKSRNFLHGFPCSGLVKYLLILRWIRQYLPFFIPFEMASINMPGIYYTGIPLVICHPYGDLIILGGFYY